jgi:hypothetical protein
MLSASKFSAAPGYFLSEVISYCLMNVVSWNWLVTDKILENG